MAVLFVFCFVTTFVPRKKFHEPGGEKLCAAK